MNVLDDLQSEVQRLADELTPELLPALLERMTKRDGIVNCERHLKLLFPYVKTQVTLTKVKRWYWNGDNSVTKAMLDELIEHRNKLRSHYRSTPCTCWVPKR